MDKKKMLKLVYPPKVFLLPTNTCYGIACHVFDIKSYNKIYEIKNRSFKKPLVILVPNFEWLSNYTVLTQEQIQTLKEDATPFTILTNIKSRKKLIPLNYKMLTKIAIRVATNEVQKETLKENGLLFLTSANISGETEITEEKKLEKVFGDYIEDGVMKILKLKSGETKTNNGKSSSDLFLFEGKTTQRKYLRKNGKVV